MDRLSHSTTRATLIYLHKTAGRDRKIADALGKLVENARGTEPQGTEGHASPEGHAGGTSAE